MAKRVYTEYNWDNLEKRLKQNVDKLARRQRAFEKVGNNALSRHMENVLDNDFLFQKTKKGYISKGMQFYKEGGNIVRLQKAIATLEGFLNNSTYKSVKTYQKSVKKKEDGIKGYIEKQLQDKNVPFDIIDKVLSNPNIVDDFIRVMNDNVNSKLSSDLIASPLLDSFLALEQKAVNETLNTITNQVDVTNRLYSR